MSLFLAVVPPLEAVEDLRDAIVDLRQREHHADLRWTSTGRWHITLAFFGDPGEHVDEEVAEHLAALAEERAVSQTRLSGAGTFGGTVLWVGLEEGSARDDLTQMVSSIPALVRGTGVTMDRRAWHPHLTIARTRARGQQGVLTAHQWALASYRGPVWDVTDLRLIRSTGGPNPVHQVVSTVPLT